MRLLLALCLVVAVVAVTVTPASAAPQPDLGSWLKKVQDRVQNVIDKVKPYRDRILQLAGTYRSVRDSWGTIKDLFRGRRSVEELENSDSDEKPDSPDGLLDDEIASELDHLVESIVVEVIAADITGKNEDWQGILQQVSSEEIDNSDEDSTQKK